MMVRAKAKLEATGPSTVECKIGEIFSEMENGIQSGWNLHDIIDESRSASQPEKEGKRGLASVLS